jgi:copper chaperone
MSTTTFTVVGMTCDHCVGAVAGEVGRIDGVEDVTVDLASGVVTVVADAPIPTHALVAAVDEAGYELAP